MAALGRDRCPARMFASSAVTVPTPPVTIPTVVVVVIWPIVEVSVIIVEMIIAAMTVEVAASMSSPEAATVSTATPETAATVSTATLETAATVSTSTPETAAAMSTSTPAATPVSQSFGLQHAASQSDTGNNNHDFLQHDILLSGCLCISLDFTLQHGSIGASTFVPSVQVSIRL